MVSASAPFPNRPFNLRVETWLIQQNTNTVQSLVGWQLWIDKTGYSPTWSGSGQADRAMIFSGYTVGSSSTPGFDFNGNGPWLILSGQNWQQHNTSSGALTFAIRGAADYAILGYAQVDTSMTPPVIPTYGLPNAPINGIVTDITRNSMNYRFGYGGGKVDGYTSRWVAGETPNWANAVEVPGNDGLVQMKNLKPGTMYWFQTVAYNEKGRSPWGAAANARTLAGAWISDGTAWKPAEVLISDGTTWKPAEVMISDGSSWLPAG